MLHIYLAASTLTQNVPSSLGGPATIGDFAKDVSDILFYLVGAVAVGALIYGGLLYALSGGDQGRVESAKNTILYAIVGIVIAVLSYAIVNFVIGRIS